MTNGQRTQIKARLLQSPETWWFKIEKQPRQEVYIIRSPFCQRGYVRVDGNATASVGNGITLHIPGGFPESGLESEVDEYFAQLHTLQKVVDVVRGVLLRQQVMVGDDHE